MRGTKKKILSIFLEFIIKLFKQYGLMKFISIEEKLQIKCYVNIDF